MFIPPFTLRVSSTTKLDSAEARNTYAGASSAGCAARPIDVSLDPNSGSVSGSTLRVTCSAVQVGPGATTLTRVPCGMSCWASPFERLLIAPPTRRNRYQRPCLLVERARRGESSCRPPTYPSLACEPYAAEYGQPPSSARKRNDQRDSFLTLHPTAVREDEVSRWDVHKELSTF